VFLRSELSVAAGSLLLPTDMFNWPPGKLGLTKQF